MLTALALVFEERTKMVYYYLYLAHKRITQLEDVGCLLAALMGNGICEERSRQSGVREVPTTARV